MTGVAGTLYSQILTGVQFGTMESLGLFYGVVGFWLFVIVPQGRVIVNCVGQLRKVEAELVSDRPKRKLPKLLKSKQ